MTTTLEPPPTDRDAARGSTGFAPGDLGRPVALREFFEGVGVLFRLPPRDVLTAAKATGKAAMAASKAGGSRAAMQAAASAVAEAGRAGQSAGASKPVSMARALALPTLAMGAILWWGAWSKPGAAPATERQMPETFVADWRAINGRHKGRVLRVRRDELAFQVDAQGTFRAHAIKAVERQPSRGDTTDVLVAYDNEGRTDRLRMQYVAVAVGSPTLRLSQPSGVEWVRQ